MRQTRIASTDSERPAEKITACQMYIRMLIDMAQGMPSIQCSMLFKSPASDYVENTLQNKHAGHCYSQEEEEGEPGDVEVPLGPEQAHVVLNLDIQVAVSAVVSFSITTVLFHLTDGVCETRPVHNQTE